MASRLASRTLQRTPTQARVASSGQKRAASAGYGRYGDHFISERHKVEHHAAGSAEMWRKITYYVATPTSELCFSIWTDLEVSLARVVIAIAINTWNLEQAHHHHMEKLIEENGGERVSFS